MSGESFTPRPHRLGSHSVGESLMTMTAAQFDLKDSPYLSAWFSGVHVQLVSYSVSQTYFRITASVVGFAPRLCSLAVAAILQAFSTNI